MNNAETIDLVATDQCAFNKYREDNPLWIPNLSYMDLSKYSLEGLNLRRANLSYADIWCSNLKDADLCGANIRGASIHKVNRDYKYNHD